MAEDFSYIQRNLAAVQAELAALAEKNGHQAPLLIPVTKSASDEEVLALALEK